MAPETITLNGYAGSRRAVIEEQQSPKRNEPGRVKNTYRVRDGSSVEPVCCYVLLPMLPPQASTVTGASAAGSLMLGRPFSTWPARRRENVGSSLLETLRSYQ